MKPTTKILFGIFWMITAHTMWDFAVNGSIFAIVFYYAAPVALVLGLGFAIAGGLYYLAGEDS